MPTEEMAALCEKNVLEVCGRLPDTDDFLYNPDEAGAVQPELLCSDACRAAVEGVDCRSTEYEDFTGELGPEGSTCLALSCFSAVEGACDITEERISNWDAPVASCTQGCLSAINSQACDGAHDMVGIINEDCMWQRCEARIEPVCGALDYVDGFGVALGGDVHAWLLQRAEQLCSPECRDEWNLLVGTQRVPGECGVFDQLMDARQYLDDIVCGCYLPVTRDCGVDFLNGADGSELTGQIASAACCSTTKDLQCRFAEGPVTGDDAEYEDEEGSFPWDDYAVNGEGGVEVGQESTEAEMRANARVAVGQTHDAQGLAFFDEGDPIGERIVRLQQRMSKQSCAGLGEWNDDRGASASQSGAVPPSSEAFRDVSASTALISALAVLVPMAVV